MNRLAAIFLCLACATGMARADDSWLTFDDPGGVFRAEFPGSPSVDHSTSKAGDGSDVITTVYGFAQDDYDLTLSDTDLSRFQSDAGVLLDGGVKGLKGTMATVLSDTICNLDGQLGREVIGMSTEGYKLDDRAFVVGGHLYQALTVEPKNADSAVLERLQHFRDSYHFTVR